MLGRKLERGGGGACVGGRSDVGGGVGAQCVDAYSRVI